MNVEVRDELTPQEVIRRLFAEMQDSKIAIEYRPLFDEPYTMTYEMDWTAEDVENLVQRYDTLTAALTHIGKHHDALEEEANRAQLLTETEREIWDTYIRPFEPFDGDLDQVTELEFRSETETLTEEEQALVFLVDDDILYVEFFELMGYAFQGASHLVCNQKGIY